MNLYQDKGDNFSVTVHFTFIFANHKLSKSHMNRTDGLADRARTGKILVHSEACLPFHHSQHLNHKLSKSHSRKQKDHPGFPGWPLLSRHVLVRDQAKTERPPLRGGSSIICSGLWRYMTINSFSSLQVDSMPEGGLVVNGNFRKSDLPELLRLSRCPAS